MVCCFIYWYIFAGNKIFVCLLYMRGTTNFFKIGYNDNVIIFLYLISLDDKEKVIGQ
jgi:hypothetical protein